jgi:hypothetical protein
MSSASSTVVPSCARASRRAPARIATVATVAIAIGALLTMTDTADAQGTRPAPRNGFEILASSGALVPVGAQRAALKDAPLSTAQLSYVVRSRLAVTTAVGWARSRDLVSDGDPKLSVFTYDVGIEARAPRWLQSGETSLTPIAGVGAGGRSYNHRGRDVDATHNLAGYIAAGAELGVGRVRLRLEARDYVSAFRPLVGGGEAVARNDVVIIAGLRFARRRA